MGGRGALDKVRGVSPVLRAQLQGLFRMQALLWVEAALGPGTGLSWGQLWFCFEVLLTLGKSFLFSELQLAHVRNSMGSNNP